MTNTISMWLGALILALFAADYFYLGWDIPVFVGRKLLELVEYLAFWR